MTRTLKLLAASSAFVLLSACATSDDRLSDEQTFGINDDQYTAKTADGKTVDGMDSVSDAMRVGCDDDDQFNAEGCDDPMDSTADMSPAPTMSIAELASANGLSQLVNALSSVGLAETLSNPGNYTVFAPTDSAFANAALGGADEAAVKDLLLSHVIDGRYSASDVMSALEGKSLVTLPTLGSNPITFYKSGDGFKLVGPDNILVPVANANVEATNGIVHVIGTVLQGDN